MLCNVCIVLGESLVQSPPTRGSRTLAKGELVVLAGSLLHQSQFNFVSVWWGAMETGQLQRFKEWHAIVHKEPTAVVTFYKLVVLFAIIENCVGFKLQALIRIIRNNGGQIPST